VTSGPTRRPSTDGDQAAADATSAPDGNVSWRTLAACRGLNPSLFYDPHPVAIDTAKQVCARCPVRATCKTQALAAGEEYGVWGGLSADERPAPKPSSPQRPGPPPALSDDELYDLFDAAEPDRAALDQLLEHTYLPTATAYKHLARAERLGVVEHRGRSLFPARR